MKELLHDSQSAEDEEEEEISNNSNSAPPEEPTANAGTTPIIASILPSANKTLPMPEADNEESAQVNLLI